MRRQYIPKLTPIALAVLTALPAMAQTNTEQAGGEQEAGALEEVIVTATKRVENIQDIPVSITVLSGEDIDLLAGGVPDIRFLNGRVANLTVESSFGRVFPRFYMRGYGNTDFDLNASQPVSLVVDEVVQENPILKGFPLFDVQRVEALRLVLSNPAPAGSAPVEVSSLTLRAADRHGTPLVAGAMLGLAGSWVAVGRHLKRFRLADAGRPS